MKKSENPENIRKYQRYFSHDFCAYGLSQDDFYESVSHFLPEFQKMENNELRFIEMESLIKSGIYEPTSLVIHILSKSLHTFDDEYFTKFSEWFEFGFSNWALTDGFCHYVLSPLLIQEKISINQLESWALSQSPFKRRAVPVSFVKLLPKVESPQKLFHIVENLITHKEKPVQQGCGWFFRESYVHFPDQLVSFLLPRKNQCGGILLSYSREKMPSEVKQSFMKRS
ncbi:MAG: DNA alkylation repair protein [Bacteroidales bacterium]|jgi:hypothetical protein|nr:DNA alkylation repair protein [Bacteroidales bacterium]